MRSFRFSIAGLIVFTLVCGVAFASLKESSDLWERGIFSFTLLFLLAAVLLAMHRTESRRAFWLGFALFGSAYLGLSLVPPVESRLISSQGLEYLRSKFPGLSPLSYIYTITSTGPGGPSPVTATLALSPSGNSVPGRVQNSVKVWSLPAVPLRTGSGSSPENFVKIGHSWLALALAYLGGILSRRLSRAPKRSSCRKSQFEIRASSWPSITLYGRSIWRLREKKCRERGHYSESRTLEEAPAHHAGN